VPVGPKVPTNRNDLTGIRLQRLQGSEDNLMEYAVLPKLIERESTAAVSGGFSE
jgi:hypothetical protein